MQALLRHPARAARLAAAGAMLALALFAPGPVLAQTKTGTTFGVFTLIEPDARLAAMGNAGAAAGEGLAGVFYNPGAVAGLEKHSFEFVHADWFAGIRYDWIGYAQPLGRIGTVYGTFTSLNSGEMPVRTVTQPLGTGERFSVKDLALSLGFAYRFSLRFSAAGQVNYLQENIFHTSAQAFTFTAGTLYRVSADGLRIGATLSNFGTSATYSGTDLAITYDNVPGQNGDNSTLPGARGTDPYSVPVTFRVGVAYPFALNPDAQLLVAADALHPSDNTESLGLGAELLLRRMLGVRAGWQGLFLQDSEIGLTAGAGLRGTFDDLRYHVDYGWADQGRLEDTHRFSFGIVF
jgi:hypothetical protein